MHTSILALFTATVLVCLCSTLATVQGGPIDVSSSDYPYTVKLDKNYELKWKFNSTHIVFEARVKTNGYIGFGISHNGKMFPADVIIGWVKGGQVHFADRHTTAYAMPQMDSSQDWHLLSGTETGLYTTLTMIRKLDTCDPDDIPIKDGTTRVIFSYSPKDPASDNAISYHGPRRGSKSLLLLDPPTENKKAKPLPTDAINVDFVISNFSVPSTDTTYQCSMWKLPPDLKGKYHMIRYEPVIQKGHEKLIHHILIYFCTGAVSENLIKQNFDCDNNPPPGISERCFNAFVAWAIGGESFDYPDNIGLSMNAPDDPVYFRMETHYDNPGLRSDFVDNSGIRMYLTKQLRQHDAGTLAFGTLVTRYQIIPPYNSHFLSQGFCFPQCLEEGLGDQEIHAFANLLHAHLLGRKLRARIIRNGVELPFLQEDNNYDFNYQEARLLPNERTIKKGDSLILECEYDSSQRSSITYGGLSTRHEMCLSFMLYYPRMPLTTCYSRENYEIPRRFGGKDIFQVISKFDWTSKTAQSTFEQLVRDSSEYSFCTGFNKTFNFHFKKTNKIQVTKPYTPPPTCTKPKM